LHCREARAHADDGQVLAVGASNGVEQAEAAHCARTAARRRSHRPSRRVCHAAGPKCCTATICTPACRAEETQQGPHAILHFKTPCTTFPHVSCWARGSSSTVSHAGGRAGRACVCDHAARDAALARVPVRGIARVQLIAGVDHPQLWLLDHLLHTRQTFQCQINDNVSALSLPVTAGLECWRSGGHTDRPGPATPG
jgi:hypothetical protein